MLLLVRLTQMTQAHSQMTPDADDTGGGVAGGAGDGGGGDGGVLVRVEATEAAATVALVRVSNRKRVAAR